MSRVPKKCWFNSTMDLARNSEVRRGRSPKPIIKYVVYICNMFMCVIILDVCYYINIILYVLKYAVYVRECIYVYYVRVRIHIHKLETVCAYVNLRTICERRSASIIL